MIKKIYSAVILLSLATPAMVVAAESAEVHGLVELGVRGVDNDAEDSALFQEFRDQGDAILGQVQLDAIKNAYHLQFDAEVQGGDDQSYQLKGGHYGNFKYQFNYDEMPHSYLFNAITPISGVGSDHLIVPSSAAVAAMPLDDWIDFEYAVEHKAYGGEVEVSLHSPFYIQAGAERQEQNGLRPFGIRTPAEVPEPISYDTDNLHLKGGYLGESLSASITGSLSAFDNANHSFDFDDGSGDDLIDRTVVLPPDNDYNKLAADLSWRQLPLRSVLAVGGSYAHLENDFSVTDFNIINDATWGSFSTLNRTKFNGDVDFTNASIALTSQPIPVLDTKLYYRFSDRDDESSIISYGGPPPTTVSDPKNFDKDDFGVDVGVRFLNKNKLEAGVESVSTDRSIDGGDKTLANQKVLPATDTQDDSAYVQLKNSYFDWLTAKVRYKHLNRVADELRAPTPFFYLDQARDEWKLGLEFYPLDTLDLGLDFIHKDTDYEYAIDTRQNDRRRDVYLDATWRATAMATLSGFVGFEKVDTDVNRVTNNGGNNQTEPTYTQTIDDDYWTYGLAAKIAATDKLTFDLSWQHQESDGEVNFDDISTGAVMNGINNSDDYTKKQLSAKAIYAFDPKLKMTLGYLYEKFEYQDVNTDNYANQIIDGTDQIYYSGLNTNPDYDANVGYLMASYGF